MLLLILLILALLGCDDGPRRSAVLLPCDTKLVSVSFSRGGRWILTRPANPAEGVETYTLLSNDALGAQTVVITETRCR